MKGHDHKSSYAEHLTHMDDLALIVCLIDETPKKVNSTDAMNRLNEYPDLKELWTLSTEDAFNDMKEAILENDFDKMGVYCRISCKFNALYNSKETGSFLFN